MNRNHEPGTRIQTRRPRLTPLFMGAVFGSITAFSTAFADDTEVFFGQIDADTNVYPNVMFVLDTSGSMNYTDTGYTGSRLERMKSALNTILGSSTNVNIGLMRFNGTNDSTGIPEDQGCTTRSTQAQINSSIDDAYEKSSNGSIITSDSLKTPLLVTNSNKNKGKNTGEKNGKSSTSTPIVTRLRFKDLSIPAGAIIESATIEIEVDDQQDGSLALTLQAEDVDSAPELIADSRWISDRPVVANPVVWTIADSDDWPDGSKATTLNLADQVQSIVNRSGWKVNNHIAFIINQSGSSSNYRQFESHDSDAPGAPKLRVVYRSNAGADEQQGIAFKTAREDMKSLVNDLSATGGTPIVGACYEAVQYMLGGPVDYGRQRGNGSVSNRHRYHRVSHPGSYTGGTVSADSGCTSSNPQDNDCKSEEILDSPVYISPLTDSCQTNHIVFLSDGEVTSNSAISKVKSLIGAPACDPSSGDEACGVELATWLNETDHNENVSRDQNISTYTIGFNINSDFLSDLATAGGGT